MLIVGSMVFILMGEPPSAQNTALVTPAAFDRRSYDGKERVRDEGCPDETCTRLVKHLPKARRSRAGTAAQSDARQPDAGAVVQPGASNQKETAAPPDGSKPESETAAQPDAAHPKQETTVQPEAPKPGPGTAGPPEKQKPARMANEPALLPGDIAQKVGHKIWLNETGGSRDAIVSWNAGEEFASLGIGHFIWFPAGKTAPFEESFPRLLEFLRSQNAPLPAWLDKTPIPPCPWGSRADFLKHANSPEMTQLRQFLLDTVAGQTQFLVTRAQGARDKILDSTPEDIEREHITIQYSRVTKASKDLYPLIDYINFKGEGTNPEETAPDKQTGGRQGWGLKQVLLKMKGDTDEPASVLAEFADAAQSVLRQRIRNIPANRVWEAGWSRRIDTYRRPIIDPDSNAKGAQKEPSRKGD